MTTSSPPSTPLEIRLTRIEGETAMIRAEMASMQTANRYIEEMIHRLEDDARFTRRAALTSMVSILSAIALSALAMLLRPHGGP